MRTPLIILFILIVNNSIAQFAIINDSDGYTNVRRMNNGKSEIIGKLFDLDVFLFGEEIYDGEDWVSIYYSPELNTLEDYKKRYYKLTDNDNDFYLTGYIHKSRLKPIFDLICLTQNNTQTNLSQNNLEFKNSKLHFKLTLKKFEEKKHTITRQESWVSLIDGKSPNGVDGRLPSFEIDTVYLKLNGKIVDIPDCAIRDLYELRLKNLNIFEKENTVFIYMPYNSDGAGGYTAVWVIHNGKFLKRYIDSI
jgi:hypothetical protein